MSIELISRRGPVGKGWHAVALRDGAERLLGAARVGRGKADARAGRVQWLDVETGVARGDVRDVDGELYQARLELPAFRDGDRQVFLQVARSRPELPARMAGGPIRRRSRRSWRDQRCRCCPGTPPSSPTTAPAWTGPGPAATSRRCCTC
ncbi:hypothetical protein [Brachybacterium sp. Z12]|uniref:hypothetical protein n=1 Tax=Brachybacterium sp. Z12 TaxID=2759167 RepID=UPI00223ABC40|nr:hypothetical protein [Brachybacterium sp. Z12]